MHIDHSVALIGAGGHSLVVIEAWIADGRQLSELVLFDQDPRKTDEHRLGLTVRAFEENDIPNGRFHICIGNNAVRLRWGERLQSGGGEAHSIVHPCASVALSARVGGGCFLATRAIVGPQASIGAFTIVNHGAVVDHECRIGAGCHVAPAAVLGGAAKLGNGVLVGANATVLPGVTIGDNAIIGAGAVVLRDVPARATYVGNPAREVRR
ncbi:acetyltransferase [Devosia sp. Root635]|uniref:acetyltransferase n=1 Tax=Devosia sp. Root635 TaxID=1736575 RepID=UPI0009EC7A5F